MPVLVPVPQWACLWGKREHRPQVQVQGQPPVRARWPQALWNRCHQCAVWVWWVRLIPAQVQAARHRKVRAQCRKKREPHCHRCAAWGAVLAARRRPERKLPLVPQQRLAQEHHWRRCAAWDADRAEQQRPGQARKRLQPWLRPSIPQEHHCRRCEVWDALWLRERHEEWEIPGTRRLRARAWFGCGSPGAFRCFL